MNMITEISQTDALEAEQLLTEKELAYVEHFVNYRSRFQAYRHAYDWTVDNPASHRASANEVHARPHVQMAINYRLQLMIEDNGQNVSWLLGRLLSIVTADPRELIGLKVGCCRYCHGDGHGYQWKEREYAEALDDYQDQVNRNILHAKLPDIGGGFGFNQTLPPNPECPECHGEGVERVVARDTDNLSDEALLLYGGVKMRRDGGYEIIMPDKGKVYEMIGRIMGAFNDNLRVDHTMKSLQAVVAMQDQSPQDAARAYMDFVAAPSVAANRVNPRAKVLPAPEKS